MPLLCDRGLLHSKLIEALEYALEALELRAESRTVFLRLRKIAEGDLQDARSRKGVDPALFGKREADAMKLLSESRKSLEELENRCPSLLEPVGIINNLTLDLFAIVRHVTPCRSPGALEPVSDKKIHKAVESILKAFAHVNHAVPRRGRGAQVQADPKKRLQRHMKAQQEESAEAARIWRDGRSEETPADQVWRARERLFAWDDDRFDRALFLNT